MDAGSRVLARDKIPSEEALSRWLADCRDASAASARHLLGVLRQAD